MLVYRTNDGATIRGENAAAVVADLRAQSRAPAGTVREFMREVAARARMQTGDRVRHRAGYEAFLADLCAAGLMETVDADRA